MIIDRILVGTLFILCSFLLGALLAMVGWVLYLAWPWSLSILLLPPLAYATGWAYDWFEGRW